LCPLRIAPPPQDARRRRADHERVLPRASSARRARPRLLRGRPPRPCAPQHQPQRGPYRQREPLIPLEAPDCHPRQRQVHRRAAQPQGSLAPSHRAPRRRMGAPVASTRRTKSYWYNLEEGERVVSGEGQGASLGVRIGSATLTIPGRPLRYASLKGIGPTASCLPSSRPSRRGNGDIPPWRTWRTPRSSACRRPPEQGVSSGPRRSAARGAGWLARSVCP